MPRRFTLVLSLLAASCATTGHSVTPKFTYAPPAGTRYVRTVKIVTETSLPGSPYRELLEREFVWNIAVSKNGDNTLVAQQLQRLAVRLNGVDVIDGERVPGSNLSVDLVVDKNAKVLEVHGTDEAAKLLSGLLRQASTDSEPMFSPEAVKEIAVARFEMVVRDLVGHPTAPGSTWTVDPEDSIVRKKTLTVDKLEPCGTATCARVSAIRRGPRCGGARAMGSGGVPGPGWGEPREGRGPRRQPRGTDEIQVEPSTMIDHGATFTQTSRVTFAGAKGQPIQVELKTALEQSSSLP
jgi:hypothetical protein